MDKIDKIRENIKILKDARGKTWTEFAFDLGYENHSNLSNKIYRDKAIDNELLTNIANYFGMTSKELINGDFSDLVKDSLTDSVVISSEDYDGVIGSYFSYYFPLESSLEAEKNMNFHKAFTLHFSFYKQLNEISKGKPYPELQFSKIWNLYLVARNEGIIEASVNMLSLLGYKWYTIMLNSVENEDIQFNQNLESVDAIALLSAMSKGTKTTYYINAKKAFLEKYDTTLTNLMSTVQNSKEYYQYAYYFLAFRYGLGMMDSELTGYTVDEERSIGQQLMLYLSYMGNEYAKDYLSLFDDE